MAKKAFLVSFSPMTRVIVDVEDDTLEDLRDFYKVVKAAKEKMCENIDDYLTTENCDEAMLDQEIPYNPETDN